MKPTVNNEFTINRKGKLIAGIVVAMFTADWCPSCKSMLPVVEDVSKKLLGEVEFVKLDVDKEPELTASLGIRTIPTFLVFDQGKQVRRITGTYLPNQLEGWIRSAVELALKQRNQENN